eukprot:5818972-Amphidinium_carterae.1
MTLNREVTNDNHGFLFATTMTPTGEQRQLATIPAEIEAMQLRTIHFDFFHTNEDITKFLHQHEFPSTAEISFTIPQYVRHIRTQAYPQVPVYVRSDEAHL